MPRIRAFIGRWEEKAMVTHSSVLATIYKAGDPDSLLGKHLLEKGMATHCSILAWRIPWTEEPGGLQSMGSQIV